jgi:hypothetical protein
MSKEAAMPPVVVRSDSASSFDTTLTAVEVSAKWMGSNVAVVDHKIVFVIKEHDSVLAKSAALQKLIADASKATCESHELRVALEHGNVELTPNPRTGAHCPVNNKRVAVVPWTPPQATERAWKLIFATEHNSESFTNQKHKQLKRVAVLVSRYSKQDLHTGHFYCCVDSFLNGLFYR